MKASIVELPTCYIASDRFNTRKFKTFKEAEKYVHSIGYTRSKNKRVEGAKL